MISWHFCLENVTLFSASFASQVRAVERKILSDSLEEQRLGTAEDASAIKAREIALKLLMPVRIGGPKEAVALARAASKTWEEGAGGSEGVVLPPPPPPRSHSIRLPSVQPIDTFHGLVEVSAAFHVTEALHNDDVCMNALHRQKP